MKGLSDAINPATGAVGNLVQKKSTAKDWADKAVSELDR
jgi:hypothetical protein|tara:strand:- start:214 stop:330 length:117 start_codon:yes stop_codon:yes gene_type:complete